MTNNQTSFDKSFHPSNPTRAAAMPRKLFGVDPHQYPRPTFAKEQTQSAPIPERREDHYAPRSRHSCASVGELRRIHEKGGNPLKPFHDYLRSDCYLRDLPYGPGVSFERFEASEAWSKTEHDNGNGNSKRGRLQKLLRGKDRTGIGERFRAVLRDTTVRDSQIVALVFHTIDSLLRTVLDNDSIENSHFSTDPTVCVSNCGGVRAMFLCLVLLPRSASRKRRGRRDQQKQKPPADSDSIVVVENSHHRFPVGVVHFDDTAKRQMEWANEQRSAEELSRKRSHNKSLIVQLLVRSRIDEAARLYREWHTHFSRDDLREISQYANRFVDRDQVPDMFPGLPSPFLSSEFETRAALGIIKSVQFHAHEVSRRQKQLEKVLGGFDISTVP
eukprot:jgi/Psemu1/58107/gm1.58107_g